MSNKVSLYQELDRRFLMIYPGGINDDDFNLSRSRHVKNTHASELAQAFDLDNFRQRDSLHERQCLDFVLKIVSMSSVVSVFEKVAFKNYLSDRHVWGEFLTAFYNVITNNNEENFNEFVFVLTLKANEGNANPSKWPLITYLLVCFNPFEEVFVKPTTIKRIMNFLEADFTYQSTPNYQTYQQIKEMILDYKNHSQVADNCNNFTLSGIMISALNENED